MHSSKTSIFTLLKVLLKRGAALDTTDMDDDTALNLAAKWGHNSVVRALIAAGSSEFVHC